METLDTQIGGSHYKTMKIQPIEYTLANNLGFCEGNIIKYIITPTTIRVNTKYSLMS